MSEPAINPIVSKLSFLLGRWKGNIHAAFTSILKISGAGMGLFPPAIPEFHYTEEINITHRGTPNLEYTSQTWNAQTQKPMHSEKGYWKILPGI